RCWASSEKRRTFQSFSIAPIVVFKRIRAGIARALRTRLRASNKLSRNLAALTNRQSPQISERAESGLSAPGREWPARWTPAPACAIMQSHNKVWDADREIYDDADLARSHGPGP